jgi:hypothetical protein
MIQSTTVMALIFVPAPASLINPISCQYAKSALPADYTFIPPVTISPSNLSFSISYIYIYFLAMTGNAPCIISMHSIARVVYV